ncbi:MAG: hypothetical protein E7361_01765 [Clostridiales bacterium]|nr:hypothetical protein [Clostridiales bacterium]
MSTKTKIVISIIALCIILALIAISIVLVLTAPVHVVDDSTFVVKYQGGVVADVEVEMEDHNLYKSDETNSTMIDIEKVVDFTMTDNTAGESETYNLGMFNKGQLMDITKADTIMRITVSMADDHTSNPILVKLAYNDTGVADSNVRLVVSAVLNSSTSQMHIEENVVEIGDAGWDNIDLFQSSKILRYSQYDSITITVKAQVVSYADGVRLDGGFALSLIGA